MPNQNKQWIAENFFMSSEISETYFEELEELFFFNPNQGKVHNDLKQTIETYGYPCIRKNNNRLYLQFESGQETQTLYLFRDGCIPELAGVVVYIREQSSLRVLYIGLIPQLTYSVTYERCLLLDIISALRVIGKKLKDVRKIEFGTSKGWIRLSV